MERSGVSEARERTAILRRSCEPCRAQKARCLVGTNGSGEPKRCQRCIDHGIGCVFENALARPKKLKTSARTRVKNVEDKLDGLIALISAQKEPEPQPEPLDAAPSIPYDPPPTHPAFSQVFSLSTAYSPPNPFLDTFGTGTGGFSYFHDVISRGIVSEEMAMQLIAEFMSNPERFPFILLKPTMTLEHLRRERPYLLLATFVAVSEAPLQFRLALEFQRVFSQACIIDSQNSLDLLQGLLVFCAWHHRYFTPKQNALYRLSQIAVSMAVDLNLPVTSHAIAHLSTMEGGFSQHNYGGRYWEELERLRTFLGCYSLTASIASSHHKPSHLKHGKNITDAAHCIAQLNDAPTNVTVPAMMQIRRLHEDIERLFQYNLPEPPTEMDEMVIEATAKALEKQVHELKDSLPLDLWNRVPLQLGILYLFISINEISLVTPLNHHPTASPPSTPCCKWCTSPTRLSLLLALIRATQTYLTTYMSLPAAGIRGETVLKIGRHIDALLLLGRASSVPELTNPTIRALADVARYLADSERKMDEMVTRDAAGGEERRDYFWQLRQVFRQCLAQQAKHVGSDGSKCEGELEHRMGRAFQKVLTPEGEGGDGITAAPGAEMATGMAWAPAEGGMWTGTETVYDGVDASSSLAQWFQL